MRLRANPGIIALATLCLLGSCAAQAQAIEVVNMIPRSLSGETERDAEPNVAVNPANPLMIAASAFTPDPLRSGNGPIFVSEDGGATWRLNVVLPGGNATNDVTLRFGGTSNVLYAGILRQDRGFPMNLLRKADFLAPGLMTVLLDRIDEDQPYVQAATVSRGPDAGKDRAYFGFNSFKPIDRKTARIEQSLDIGSVPPPAGLTTQHLETRTTCGRNGPSVRPAVHPDGTVYVAFFGYRHCQSGTNTVSDVVVVRDNAWGTGATPYRDLREGPFAGVRVATDVKIVPFLSKRSRLGTQRIGSHISIAVDPRRGPKTVYLAWADGASADAYTIHLRRSTNGGITWTGDLRTIVRATNPAVAVNGSGRVGFLYQKLVGSPPDQRWETHFERSDDGSQSFDVVLASLPDVKGSYDGFNTIGDYNHLLSVGEDFYGVFSGSNTPDRANFPSGIVYLRNADWNTHTLKGLNDQPVPVSIDPFFFHAAGTEPAGKESEALPSGEVRERPIAAGETHVYRVRVAAERPLAIVIEQRGVNLTVEAQGPATRLAADSGDFRWEYEVLLLEGEGEHRVEVRPRDKAVVPGRYTIQAEELPATSDPRRAAFSLMSRAGQQAAGRSPQAWRQALASYREALAAWRSLEEQCWEAAALSIIAGLEKDVSELRPAVEDYLQALARWQQLDEPHRQAATLNRLGETRLQAGDFEAARESLQDALSRWQRLGERFEEGLTGSNLCFLEQTTGALQAALSCYQKPLALFRDLGVRSHEARILTNIGGAYDLLGEPDAALESYQQALALRRELGESLEEARLLINIAVIHRILGEWQEALRLYGQAQDILKPLGDRFQETMLLVNRGFAYNSLGEPQRALAFLENALKLLREIGDRRVEVITLNNLGNTWRRIGDLGQALGYHRQALDLAKALGDRRQENLTRLRLAEVRLEQDDPSAALGELDSALAYLKEMGIRQGERQALQLRGRALIEAARPHEALPVLQEVLGQCRDLRDRAGEADALHALATAERSLGLRDEARSHAGEAVARVEELRAGFVSPDLRAAFLATQRRAYSLMIDLLMDRHAVDPGGNDARKALEFSERARARSLLDVLYSGHSFPAGSTASAGLLERRQALRRRLSSKAYQQLQQSGAKAQVLRGEIEALMTELDGVEAEIRRLDPRYAAVFAPSVLGVEDIAKLLDPDTLLLEYSLGEDRSYLWAVGAGSFRSFLLPPQREIETLARRLHEELSTLEAGTGRPKSTATELSRILLQDAWPEASRYRRLVVVPDAALHLVPFGALPAPGAEAPLLDQLEIVYLPSATTLGLQRQRSKPPSPAVKWAAILADPVFAADDPRLNGPSLSGKKGVEQEDRERGTPGDAALQDLERLPATRREAEKIAALAPAGQVWIARDFEASREAVLSGFRDYRAIHFATHGLANTRNPELSGLVLSLVDAAGRPQEGFFGLSDIYDLDLAADLVVLSGCQTALGKEVRGEGVMGLTRGFLHAGVPRVVASLWRVQDRATAELMTRFYRALWKDHRSPAAALREAQRSLRRDPRYRDPYSWAGFVLQGDWR